MFLFIVITFIAHFPFFIDFSNVGKMVAPKIDDDVKLGEFDHSLFAMCYNKLCLKTNFVSKIFISNFLLAG